MFEIRKYNDADKEVWNAYVEHARNATFLFNRNYMDYHSDRFKDYSLMFYNNGKLHSILPAHQVGKTLCSHFGLTYAGLLTTGHASTENISVLIGREQGIELVVVENHERMVMETVAVIIHVRAVEKEGGVA